LLMEEGKLVNVQRTLYFITKNRPHCASNAVSVSDSLSPYPIF
jgi:hypothetical protein